jgi:small GTP-binding protein
LFTKKEIINKPSYLKKIMPINADYEYINAEKKYHQAQTLKEKITATEEMIKTAPKHKGSENLLALLRSRLKKFKEQQEKSKKAGKATFKTIKKEGFQVVLVGLPNSGKSSLLASLTNAKPKIDVYPFTTKEAEIGTLDYEGVKAQIIDMPSIGSEYLDLGLLNTADCLLVVLENLEDLEKVLPLTEKASGKKIIVINKSDLLSPEELRKLQEKIKSKRLDARIISTLTNQGLKELKEKIFLSMNSIRVYTKEPGKQPTQDPLVLSKDSTVKDAAEKILKGFSNKVKETRVTGPSSKFPNQKVGLAHILKDKDIVEFHTF